jgi:hypothetical protein
VVFDLNGVLVRRGAFVKNQPRDIHVRPGCSELLNWVQDNATLSFWSSVTSKNMVEIMSKLRKCGVRISESSICLCQSSCISSDTVGQSSLEQPQVTNFNEAKTIFLKDLQLYTKKAKLDSWRDVLLVDDSPIKCVMNDAFSAVHPPSWAGCIWDTFLQGHLQPWLARLFQSNEDVPDFVRHNPLPDGQLPLSRSDPVALIVVKNAKVRPVSNL